MTGRTADFTASPPLSICPLASGSKGNAIYIAGGKSAILLDAGLSGVELERRMAARGISPESIDGVVISHEHTDHIKGAGVLSRRYNIPLYINEKTFQAASARLGRVACSMHFQCGHPFRIGELIVNPFSTSHDARDPSGFTFEHLRCKLSVVTDLGIATNLVKNHLQDSSLVYVEANHDPEMLHCGSYPWYLKQRIRSRRGHLSNQEAGELLCEIKNSTLNGKHSTSNGKNSTLNEKSSTLNEKSSTLNGKNSTSNGKNSTLNHVILAHLSEENNTPEKAWQTVSHMLGDPRIKVQVAMPDMPGEMIHISGQ